MHVFFFFVFFFYSQSKLRPKYFTVGSVLTLT